MLIHIPCNLRGEKKNFFEKNYKNKKQKGEEEDRHAEK